MENEFLQTEEAIVAALKTVFDPEIPVNIYDLGLIYKVHVEEILVSSTKSMWRLTKAYRLI